MKNVYFKLQTKLIFCTSVIFFTFSTIKAEKSQNEDISGRVQKFFSASKPIHNFFNLYPNDSQKVIGPFKFHAERWNNNSCMVKITYKEPNTNFNLEIARRTILLNSGRLVELYHGSTLFGEKFAIFAASETANTLNVCLITEKQINTNYFDPTQKAQILEEEIDDRRYLRSAGNAIKLIGSIKTTSKFFTDIKDLWNGFKTPQKWFVETAVTFVVGTIKDIVIEYFIDEYGTVSISKLRYQCPQCSKIQTKFDLTLDQEVNCEGCGFSMVITFKD